MDQCNCLRAIGQSLQVFQLEAFQITKEGSDYVVYARILPQNGSEFLLADELSYKLSNSAFPECQPGQPIHYEGTMRYNAMSISWLNAHGRRKRRNRFAAKPERVSKLSHLLRTLDEYLDRRELNALNIAWRSASVYVDSKNTRGELERKSFSPRQLQELDFRMRFRRSDNRRLSRGQSGTLSSG